MGRQTAASQFFSARRVTKQLNEKEDVSILCEILLHFISVLFWGFFFQLIVFPLVSNDTPHVTQARLHGWRFNIWSRLFFLCVCFGLNNKQIFQRGEKASGAANESQAVCVCLQVAFCPGRNSNLSSRDF